MIARFPRGFLIQFVFLLPFRFLTVLGAAERGRFDPSPSSSASGRRNAYLTPLDPVVCPTLPKGLTTLWLDRLVGTFCLFFCVSFFFVVGKF